MAALRQQSVKPSRNSMAAHCMAAHCEAERAGYPAAAKRRVAQLRVEYGA
jgi:hypothetical protein